MQFREIYFIAGKLPYNIIGYFYKQQLKLSKMTMQLNVSFQKLATETMHFYRATNTSTSCRHIIYL